MLPLMVHDVVWNREASEFVLKADVDRDLAAALSNGSIGADISVDMLYVQADGTYEKMRVGRYEFARFTQTYGYQGHGYSMPDPRRSAPTDRLRLSWSPPHPDYYNVYPGRVALQLLSSSGAALGAPFVARVPSQGISFALTDDGRMQLPERE